MIDHGQMSEAAPIYDDLVRTGAAAKAHADSLEPLIESTGTLSDSHAALESHVSGARQRDRDAVYFTRLSVRSARRSLTA